MTATAGTPLNAANDPPNDPEKDQSSGQDPDTISPIRLACVELGNFRRLAQVRLDFDETTTIVVGANNSGKTSLLVLLRNFLSDSPRFRAFDISISKWATLRSLGEKWEALDADPSTELKDADDWDLQHQQFLACMPFLDLWFDAKDGAYHYVAPFITTLMWSGGSVGIRLRLEPAADANDLRNLAWRYREARIPVLNMKKNGNAWPTDLLDYWLRHPTDLNNVRAYRLDPAKGPLSPADKKTAQDLPSASQPVELALLRQLIRVDFVPAQRGLGAEDDEVRSESAGMRPGLFSNQLLRFARQHLNFETSAHGQGEALNEAISSAQSDLDEQIAKALNPAISDVQILGYPGLHDPQEIHFRTRIRTTDLLAHSTAIQYRHNKNAKNESLPEHSIGLGYQNLQSLSFMLVSFREERLKPRQGNIAAVHLVMVEEPEAHLHAQVQRNFATNAYRLIRPKGDENDHLRTQLLISTHSSHLAHGNSFTRLRYMKRTKAPVEGGMPSTQAINLASAFGNDIGTMIFAQRYFQVQHTDLLFADAAVFVEGTAERMLVPRFISRDFAELEKRYLSFLDIGGSHAHRLRPLVEHLGIPTVIITDIDPVVPKVVGNRTTKVAVCINGQPDLECGNDTLTTWHPKLTDFQAYGTPKKEHLEWTSTKGGKVRFAWQTPIPAAGRRWPSSFEDALILSNISWFEKLDKQIDPKSQKKIKHRGPLGKIVNLVIENQDPTNLSLQLHETLHTDFKKGDFAATIFERFDSADLICPSYISEALSWLSEQLESIESIA